jgi:hypothetical protein
MIDVLLDACSNNFRIIFPERVGNSKAFNNNDPLVKKIKFPFLFKEIPFLPAAFYKSFVLFMTNHKLYCEKVWLNWIIQLLRCIHFVACNQSCTSMVFSPSYNTII